MAKQQTRPRQNRYKHDGGKGRNVLAVFLVAIMLVLVAAYYFFSWHPDRKQEPPRPQVVQIKPPAVVPSPQKPVDSPVVTIQEPLSKPAGTTWEHYTDDTRHDQPVKPSQPLDNAQGRGELAIIIDDMGSSLQEARSLVAIGVPLTFAVIPGLRHDREVSDYAAGQGIELMLHMPMQSREYPKRRLESNGLLLSHSEQDLQNLVENYFTRVPQAVGANNHTGSAFTEDLERMRIVLGLLKRRGLFFVDSVTTPATTGPRVATELRMKTARRDVFLDNEQDEAYIRGQLAKAVERARKQGRAIAICHPHPTTISTLAKLLPELQKREGIRLTRASQLVR